MLAVETIEFLRQAGYVSRSHTMRILGRYPSCEHVHNMINILMVLHPQPTINLIKLFLYHDTGEFCAGDTPSPAKSHFGLGGSVNRVEEGVREVFGLNVDVSYSDIRWLKSIDLLEFYLFCNDQMLQGNHLVTPDMHEAQDALDRMVTEGHMPEQVVEYYQWIRTRGRPILFKRDILERMPKE